MKNSFRSIEARAKVFSTGITIGAFFVLARAPGSIRKILEVYPNTTDGILFALSAACYCISPMFSTNLHKNILKGIGIGFFIPAAALLVSNLKECAFHPSASEVTKPTTMAITRPNYPAATNKISAKPASTLGWL